MSEFALRPGTRRERTAKKEVFVRQFRSLLEACAVRQGGSAFLEEPGTVEGTICLPDQHLDWVTYAFSATCDAKDLARPFGPENRLVHGSMSRTSKTIIKGEPCRGPGAPDALLATIVQEDSLLAMVAQSAWVLGYSGAVMRFESAGLTGPFDDRATWFEQDLKQPVESSSWRFGRFCLRALRHCMGRNADAVEAGIAEAELVYEAENLIEIADAFGVENSMQLVDISSL